MERIEGGHEAATGGFDEHSLEKSSRSGLDVRPGFSMWLEPARQHGRAGGD
jgi:hypothetical protein